MLIKNGLIFDLQEGFQLRDLCTDGKTISAASTDDTVLDGEGCYVIPALVDVHFHGAMGEDFSDATPDGLQKIADYELSEGVMYICPAGMTLPEETLTDICKTAKAFAETQTEGAELVGIHLEGPFLSEGKKGAQNGAYLRDPNAAMLLRLQEASGGLVRLVTMAPERDGAMEMIAAAVENGITASVGHTTANYEIAKAAFDAGARHCTHLYNGMNSLHHREPTVLGAAFDHPEVRAEIICDGIHIHPTVIRMTWALYGAERMVLISDSLRCCGMADGQYMLGGQEIVVKGNRATLADNPNTLAGSNTSLLGCMKTAIKFGIPVADAVRAASYNPAAAIGMTDRLGTLDIGKDASFLLLDKETLDVKAMVFKGQKIA